MNTITKKEQLFDLLIDYTANIIISSEIAEFLGTANEEAVIKVLGEFQRAWDSADCDPEGATKEQDRILDEIVDNYAKELLQISIKPNE